MWKGKAFQGKELSGFKPLLREKILRVNAFLISRQGGRWVGGWAGGWVGGEEGRDMRYRWLS